MHKRLILCLALLVLASCQSQSSYQSQAEEVFPPVKISKAALFRMGNVGISPAFFHGKWTGVMFASASCDTECQKQLTLVDGIGVIQFLLVIVDLADHSRLRELKDKYPGVEISMGTTAASIDNFIAQFEDESIARSEMEGYLYLVNPDAQLSYMLATASLQLGDMKKELMGLTE